MTATAEQVAELRRMIAEPDETTYTDEDLEALIESHPLVDERGELPYTWDTSTQPPTQDDNEDWIPTYDLHAAAADIWQEKAAVVAEDFDFEADGGRYSRSQVYEQFMKQARYHRSRRAPRTLSVVVYPKGVAAQQVVNRLEREPWT